MKYVSVNVYWIQVFVMINSVGMMINIDANVKNWLIKVCVIKEYACNPSICECECDKSCDVGEYLDYKNCKCRKSLADKLVEECNENIDEVKLTEITLYEQSALGSVLILFTISTCIVIKRMFLYMIMFIMRKIINHIKWE